MTALPEIPALVLERQREASDPALSAWVSANAGSGKTYVLAQRVIRLLLGGTPPAKILCLTFTKAAAANMATTVFDRLAQWTALGDDALDAAIHAMTDQWPAPERRAAARRLFAQALEAPGGLKVQTIHAFCTRLLQQFPFEANVPARFAVLDEASESQLLEQLIFNALLQAAAKPDSALGRALATVIGSATDQTFRDVLHEAIQKRTGLMAWLDQAGGGTAAIAELSGLLGLGPDETTSTIETRFFMESLIAESEWPAIRRALADGSASDIDQSDNFGQLATLSGSERLRKYCSIFCTQKGEPRRTVVTKAIRDRYPVLAERLRDEQVRVCDLLVRRRAAVTRDRTAALVTIAGTVINGFRAEKDRRGLLDYDDLIDKTGALLTRVEAAWVHYKLDLGIDHVLIDEAQDTSPRQWEVIERLVSEFATGEGARGQLQRTIFAVGDDKQSIFSFQGALPEAFAQKRRGFHQAYKAAGLPFLPLEFKHSFRSVQVVLDAVDLVFKTPDAFRGLDDPVATVHTAVRQRAPGLVEIWPLIEPEKTAAVEGWDAPFDTTSETSPRVTLARRIAKCVGRWIARSVQVGDGPRRRAVTPGDVLVLVRQRGALFEAVIRALKNAGIAVAGADRLILTEHIAVMDLLVLADALLLPEDDLALATVLKSPLFGLNEEQLFDLAWNRKGSLRAALRETAPENPALAEAAARLDRLAAAARRETPFGFYGRVLGPEGGRKRFLARIGAEATDALDEFLNIALDYERQHPASLQGFVAWLRSANAEVKRDMEISRDEVRVMTVHGAKGLEAPIVFLADTTTPPAGPPGRQPRLLPLTGAQARHAPAPMVWAGRKDDDVPLVAAARLAACEAAENEHRRLLYVGMTRAADRLVVCGAMGERGKPPGCWYDLVHGALTPAATEEPADDGEGPVWRLRQAWPAEIEAAVANDAAGTARHGSGRPVWLDQDAPPERPSEQELSPSRAYDESSAGAARAGTGERLKALARGTLVHRLLQALPAIPPDRRQDAAHRHLARAATLFTGPERDSIVEQVSMVLDDPRFGELFGPDSRAEVPIVGRIPAIGRTIAVSGQVDRLAVTAGGVLIADYKTNRPAPRRPDEVPPGYVAQLALYRAVLRLVYPERPVRAALVWTDVPNLMEISAEALDRAIVTLT
ncbi:MAG TPA: double-strand break repair helicase AddA [Xanthobacteraceae bacterium]|jgi:ATP-dependent helicase/nuclease subunit A